MDRPGLKRAADASLCEASYPPRRLISIHTGVVIGASVLLSFVSRLLTSSMGSAGGISGLGTQAALSTTILVLELLFTVLLPFWSAGLSRAALDMARGRSTAPGALLEGFRRYKRVLSSTLLMVLQYLPVVFIAYYLGGQIFLLTPFAKPLYAAVLRGEDAARLMETAQLPYIGIILLVFAVLALPIFYRYRMVGYLIVDEDEMGGIQSLFVSRAMMRGRGMELFRLDLSFWWFYALVLLTTCVTNAPALLELLGIHMGDGICWACPILGAAAQFGVYVWGAPKLELTYAHCYEDYLQNAPPEPKIRPMPKPEDLPWDGWSK